MSQVTMQSMHEVVNILHTFMAMQRQVVRDLERSHKPVRRRTTAKSRRGKRESRR